MAETTVVAVPRDGTITITNGQFPFFKADGNADNIGVS